MGFYLLFKGQWVIKCLLLIYNGWLWCTYLYVYTRCFYSSILYHDFPHHCCLKIIIILMMTFLVIIILMMTLIFLFLSFMFFLSSLLLSFASREVKILEFVQILFLTIFINLDIYQRLYRYWWLAVLFPFPPLVVHQLSCTRAKSSNGIIIIKLREKTYD